MNAAPFNWKQPAGRALEAALNRALALDPDARSSLRALDGRRVVIVADVVGEALPDTVALADVVAVHADADDLLPGADPEDLEDLGWYATQEIPDLLG